MKIFGIGLNKTGTTTLGVCFKTLGFKHAPYDKTLMYRHEAGDLDAILSVAHRYQTFEDWPWPLIYKELDEHFPDAKFVLTERISAAKWYDSLCRHSEHTGTPRVRRIAYGHEMPQGHADEHLATYASHSDAVRAHFHGRPGKLLEVCWEEDSSWEALCSFLGLSVPTEAFPHANPRPEAK